MIKLLSMDFDGTLVDHFERPAVVPGLIARLRELRAAGVLWAINTGRDLGHIVHGLDEFGFPVQPDFVLTSERDLFHRLDGGGWQPYGDWNERCAQAHDDLYAQAQPVLGRILEFLEKETSAQAIWDQSRPVGLVAEKEGEMDRIVAFLEKAREEMPTFAYQRNTRYVRFCHADYSKGAVLGELARLIGVGREEIFACGDHHNDIPMLDGKFAQWVACPGNSAEATKETVLHAGGYVARGVASMGTLEGLDHFLVGKGLGPA
jgi:hydroxymethylpyrimidine pyrophosphatase-like HAD family hydrolase